MKNSESALSLFLAPNYKNGEADAYLNIGSLYSISEIYSFGMA